VFGKDAMKKDDRNHPNSMQHGELQKIHVVGLRYLRTTVVRLTTVARWKRSEKNHS